MKLINFICDCTSRAHALPHRFHVFVRTHFPLHQDQDHAVPARTWDRLCDQKTWWDPQTPISLDPAGVMSPRASSVCCDAGQPRRAAPRRTAHFGDLREAEKKARPWLRSSVTTRPWWEHVFTVVTSPTHWSESELCCLWEERDPGSGASSPYLSAGSRTDTCRWSGASETRCLEEFTASLSGSGVA